uniref:Lipase n=1 Tax=Thermosporothrix sp. COM3 TaxID=2490863 RepID=A0A455SXQ7_9CHLR|nr:lipase [Thermosporothrix sp. COM3]
MQTLIQDGATVLFQGDSITDAGRIREDKFNLGAGYAMMAAAWFQMCYPEKRVTFLNRGIGGDLSVDLTRRWDRDCLALRPDWVSILVGINDVWRRYTESRLTTVETYEQNYRTLLDPLRQMGTRLILCEPFVLHTPSDREQWREDLNPKIEVVRKLAREYDAVLVPFDEVFAQAVQRREPQFWAYDGVHPTEAGHALMARTWLRSIHALE